MHEKWDFMRCPFACEMGLMKFIKVVLLHEE